MTTFFQRGLVQHVQMINKAYTAHSLNSLRGGSFEKPAYTFYYLVAEETALP